MSPSVSRAHAELLTVIKEELTFFVLLLYNTLTTHNGTFYFHETDAQASVELQYRHALLLRSLHTSLQPLTGPHTPKNLSCSTHERLDPYEYM